MVGLGLVSAACSAENKQKEGEMLIRHAEEVSNLRTAGARPFRLLASFTLLGDGATNEQGSYTETWASPTGGVVRRCSAAFIEQRSEAKGHAGFWTVRKKFQEKRVNLEH